MKKIIIIDECFQCPHSFKFKPNGDLECDKKEKAIPDPYTIPSWCPLENLNKTKRIVRKLTASMDSV
jgi:hypothetical protein